MKPITLTAVAAGTVIPTSLGSSPTRLTSPSRPSAVASQARVRPRWRIQPTVAATPRALKATPTTWLRNSATSVTRPASCFFATPLVHAHGGMPQF